ncbi:MAG: hypothetical protein MRZ79_16160 [Bacteroidia bacterium]|nr:hypothetical protein [Bacteroidia bacterium]
MKHLFLLICIGLIGLFSIPQRAIGQKIIDIVPVFEENDLRMGKRKVKLGFEVRYANGKLRRSSNLKLFGISLKKFMVHVSHGSYQDGMLEPDYRAIHQNNNRLYLDISMEKSKNRLYSSKLDVPYPVHIDLKSSFDKGIQPNKWFPIAYKVHFSDGHSHRYNPIYSRLRKKLPLEIISIAEVDYRNKLLLPGSLDYIDSVMVVASHEWVALEDTLFIPVDYKSKQFVDLSAAPGMGGSDGDDAPELNIKAQLRRIGSRDFLALQITSPGKEKSFLLDVDGEGLQLTARGGTGGDGSSGSDGSDGSDGSKDSSASSGCDGGNGGNGGDGGNGAIINILTDGESYPYVKRLLSISNEGGDGGEGGSGGSGGSGGRNVDGSSASSGSDGSDGSDGSSGIDGGAPRYEIRESISMGEPSPLRKKY